MLKTEVFLLFWGSLEKLCFAYIRKGKISSAICVDVLDFLDMLFTNNRICPIKHLKKIRNNAELWKRVKTVQRLVGFS